MSLNLSEQRQIIDDSLKPTAVTTPLIDLVDAATVNFARVFMTTHKIIPIETVTANERNYLQKMLVACTRAISEDARILASIRDLVASEIAAVVGNAGLIAPLTEDFWYTYVESSVDKGMEIFAGVMVEEKTDYDAYTEA